MENMTLTDHDIEIAKANQEKGFPRICASVNLVNGHLIALKEGETGYWLIDGGRKPEAGEVDRLNNKLGISESERQAFECCSLMDTWDNYAQTLRLIRTRLAAV